MIVVIAESEVVRKELLELQMKKRGFEVSEIEASQINLSFGGPILVKRWRNPLYWIYRLYCSKHLKGSYSQLNIKWIDFLKKQYENPIIICMPPKTADATLDFTFEKNNITAINLVHTPELIKKENFEIISTKIKIMVGVREPIAQNLSIFYHKIADGSIVQPMIDPTCNFKNLKNLDVMKKYENILCFSKDDVQKYWNIYTDRYPISKNEEQIGYYNFIQNMIYRYKDYPFELLSTPFDKEKGYTIIKDGKREVFIYQLEKLDKLVPELSDWVGVPFEKLEKRNVGGDKWIGDSYKQAQKHIKLTQEYFERCYNEPYVRHFYSAEDIDKFKARWRPHILAEE